MSVRAYINLAEAFEAQPHESLLMAAARVASERDRDRADPVYAAALVVCRIAGCAMATAEPMFEAAWKNIQAGRLRVVVS